MIIRIPRVSRITGKELFISALFLYVVYNLFGSSLYAYSYSWMVTALKYMIVGLICLKWFATEKFTVKKLLFWAIILFVVAIISWKNDYTKIVITIALMLSSQDVEFENILKCIWVSMIMTTIFVVLSCKIGILADYTYSHTLSTGVKQIAHSYGFKYYSSLGYITMTLSIIYLYLQKKFSFVKTAVVLVVNYYLYRIHTTRLAFLFVVIVVFGLLLCEKWKLLKPVGFFWKAVACLMPTGLFVGTVGLVMLYANDRYGITASWLGTISSRLNYSVQGLQEYGIHLFGSKVVMYGNTAKVYGNASSGFYIDSGYLYTLLAYGVIFSIIIVLMYTIIFLDIYKSQDVFLYIWMGCILVICMINNFVLSLAYNPLLFLLPSIITKNKKRVRFTNGQFAIKG